jgi:hypothetical protein
MISDYATDATRRFLTLLIGAGVALALAPADLQAQQQDGVTQESLEEALANPDAVLDRIRDGRGAKEVKLVDVSSVVPEQQKADELRERHGDAIESFRDAAREHSVLTGALEAHGAAPGDVVAIHVGNPMDQAGEADEDERREMAVHEIMYVVISSDAAEAAEADRSEVQPADTARHDDDPGSLR